MEQKTRVPGSASAPTPKNKQSGVESDDAGGGGGGGGGGG